MDPRKFTFSLANAFKAYDEENQHYEEVHEEEVHQEEPEPEPEHETTKRVTVTVHQALFYHPGERIYLSTIYKRGMMNKDEVTVEMAEPDFERLSQFYDILDSEAIRHVERGTEEFDSHWKSALPAHKLFYLRNYVGLIKEKGERNRAHREKVASMKDKYRKRLLEMQEKNALLDDSLAATNAELRTLLAKVHTLESEKEARERAGAHGPDIASRLALANAHLRDVQGSLNRTRQENFEWKRKVTAAEATVAKLREELDASKAHVAKATTDYAALQAQLEDLTNQNEHLQAQARLAQEADAERKLLAEQQRRAAALEKDLKKARDQASANLLKATRAEAAAGDLRKERDELKERLRAQERDLLGVDMRIADLNNQHNAEVEVLRAEVAVLRATVQRDREERERRLAQLANFNFDDLFMDEEKPVAYGAGGGAGAHGAEVPAGLDLYEDEGKPLVVGAGPVEIKEDEPKPPQAAEEGAVVDVEAPVPPKAQAGKKRKPVAAGGAGAGRGRGKRAKAKAVAEDDDEIVVLSVEGFEQ